MKKTKLFTILALVVVGVFAFASCTTGAGTQNTQSENSASNVGQEQPTKDTMKAQEDMDQTMTFSGDAYNFDLISTDGESYKLSDLSGKKVYIKFWASWCPICLAGIDEFEQLNAKYESSDDVVVLTMVSPNANGEMSADSFEEWFNAQQFGFTALLDEGGSVMDEYGIRGFPTSVYIDTSGNVVKTSIGHVDNSVIESTLEGIS